MTVESQAMNGISVSFFSGHREHQKEQEPEEESSEEYCLLALYGIAWPLQS